MTEVLPSEAELAAVEGAPPTLAEFVDSSRLRSIVIGTSKDPNAKVTVLLVSPQDGVPVLAIKAPTTEAAARAVECERRMLVELAATLPEELASTVPRAVCTVDFEGRSGLVTTAVTGTPMTRAYLRHDREAVTRHHFAALARWLDSLQTATAGDRTPIDMDGDVANRIRRRFRDDPAVDSDLTRLAEINARLREHSVPRTVVHGDLWFGNLLLRRGRLTGVVDWEDADLRGEPVRDLIRFAIAYALYIDRRTRPGRRVRGFPALRASRWGAGIGFGINGTGWFPELFRDFVRDGLNRLGAPPELWRDAVLAGVAEVAARADDSGFAGAHLALFRQLSTAQPQSRAGAL
jgi:aminoglycoside phosphotransferase (APT) family kinase protein